jgi:hypothetical protein
MILYRGLKVDLGDDEPVEKVAIDDGDREFERLPETDLTRNGAYSFTTQRSVANNWNAGSGDKVVLRVDVPRTAVLSFPAYGINVHSEKEVVLTGTAIKSWDVFRNEAPSYGDVPIAKYSKKKEAA